MFLITAEDLASGLMIECDTCKAWQHGPCVGLLVEKVSLTVGLSRSPDQSLTLWGRLIWSGLPGYLLLRTMQTRLTRSQRITHSFNQDITQTTSPSKVTLNKPTITSG